METVVKTNTTNNVPTIKGVFVNTHINQVRKKKGEECVKLLEKLYGKSIHFGYLEDVPIQEEIEIIKLCLHIISDKKIPEKDFEFEAGRFHFRNFTESPLGKLVFSYIPKNFKQIILHSKNLARHIFKNTNVSILDTGENSLVIKMENNNYPIEHFKGLFFEWMVFYGIHGQVNAKN